MNIKLHQIRDVAIFRNPSGIDMLYANETL